jgi:hypothetical protein
MFGCEHLRMRFAIAVIGLLAFAQAADATILFRDDFQSDTAGTTQSGGDLDPVIGDGDVGGSWVVGEFGPTYLRTINDTVPLNDIAGPNNYVELIRTTSISRSGKLHGTGWNPADTLNQVIQLDLSMYQLTDADMTLMLYDAAPPGGTAVPFGSTSIIFEDLDTETPDLAWNTVRIIANLDSSLTKAGLLPQTYSISINGNPASVFNFFSAHNQIQSMTFFEGANNVEEYIDDVVLQTVAHPGDFDSDGDVDGADFVAWQTHFPTATGATLADGDADADGDVDGADFVVWQTNFPFTPGSGVTSIPEPESLLLAGNISIFGAILLVRRRIRRCFVTCRREDIC